MFEKTQKKNRRAYLVNYAKALDGTYMYVGRYLKYQGTEDEKAGLDRKLLILDILTAVFVAAMACTLIGEMSVQLYIVIPFVVEIIFTVLTVWYSVKLLRGKDPLKEHIHEQVAGKLPVFSIVLVVFAIISLILCIVFLLANPPGPMLAMNIIYTALHLFTAASGIMVYRTYKAGSWELME